MRVRWFGQSAFRLEGAAGTVVGVASEHDAEAWIHRGPNAIYRFALDGLEIAHFGDFGQPALRPEQTAALQGIDVLFGEVVEVGASETEIDGANGSRRVLVLRPPEV